MTTAKAAVGVEIIKIEHRICNIERTKASNSHNNHSHSRLGVDPVQENLENDPKKSSKRDSNSNRNSSNHCRREPEEVAVVVAAVAPTAVETVGVVGAAEVVVGVETAIGKGGEVTARAGA